MSSHVQDDTDASIFQNSVFDWGSQRGGSNNSLYGLDDDDDDVDDDQSNIENAASSSRYYYAPCEGISRILNINDLVDDDEEADGEKDDDTDDEDDDEIIIIAPPPRHSSSGHHTKIEGKNNNNNDQRSHHPRGSSGSSKSNNAANTMSSSWFSSIIKHRQIPSPSSSYSSPRRRRRICWWWSVVDLSTFDISRRQVILLFSLVGIIIVSCVVGGVGYAVLVGPTNTRGNEAAVPLTGDDEGVGSIAEAVVVLEAGKQQQQQQVQEMVVGPDEETTTTIAEGGEGDELFHISERVVAACAESVLDADMSECQSLCRSRMCCFEDESERYSCVDETRKHCVAYAACGNLLDDLPLDDGNYGDGGGKRRRRRRT